MDLQDLGVRAHPRTVINVARTGQKEGILFRVSTLQDCCLHRAARNIPTMSRRLLAHLLLNASGLGGQSRALESSGRRICLWRKLSSCAIL